MLMHKPSYKECFAVPFLMLGSDQTEHKLITRAVSGINFIDFFAAWIGVVTDKTDANFSITNFPQNDRIRAGGAKFESLENDAALW